jgi:hypothetical protein
MAKKISRKPTSKASWIIDTAKQFKRSGDFLHFQIETECEDHMTAATTNLVDAVSEYIDLCENDEAITDPENDPRVLRAELSYFVKKEISIDPRLIAELVTQHLDYELCPSGVTKAPEQLVALAEKFSKDAKNTLEALYDDKEKEQLGGTILCSFQDLKQVLVILKCDSVM